MRLDDFDPNINVEDQGNRGGGGGSGFGGGGGGGLLFGLLPLVFSRFGCGGVAVLLAVMFFFGGGLGLVGGGGGQVSAPTQQSRSTTAGSKDVTAICTQDAAHKAACNAFSSADKTWAKLLGPRFQAPGLRFYDQNGVSGCGAAQSAMGPFYCPRDQNIFLDTAFFDELANRFGAKGDFAQDYVIAHEFGHHIQNLLGTSDQVAQIQQRGNEVEGNRASVKLELQADCYAGVWAAQNKDRLDPGDLEEGMTAAQAIGDDTLQKESQGRVVPDSFTHGTSAQRMTWLRKGIETGDPNQCDTFSGGI